MFIDNALKELLQSYSLYIDKSEGKGENGSEQTKPISCSHIFGAELLYLDIIM